MKDIVKPSDDKRVLVIGNGFDLDLGWNTRFSDFASSSYWPQNYHNGSILSYLLSKRKVADWFDIEKEIGDFASGSFTKRSTIGYIQINKNYFNELVNGFKEYLKEEIQKPINHDSMAALVLSEILNNQQFTSIYSFNYTDLYEIARTLEIKVSFTYEHVHGALKDNDVILGAPEDKDLNKGYEFLYKTFHEHYKSNELIYDLSDAKEVVFFGHSLGPTDYHYFRSFFQTQCQETLQRKDAKKITIFTFDDTSRLSIMNQLRAMNDKKTNVLVNKNDFRIFMTINGLTPEIESFLNHLKATSKEVNDKRFARAISFI